MKDVFYSLWICFIRSCLSATLIAYWKTVFVITFWIFCCFFVFDSFRRIYVWSAVIHGCLMTHIIRSRNIIKCKVATPHRLFQIYLIIMQKQIKICLDDFVCIITNHNFDAIAFRIHLTFFVTICWWHKFRFHC